MGGSDSTPEFKQAKTVGSVQINEDTEIRVQTVPNAKGEMLVDVRAWVKKDGKMIATKSGVWCSKERWAQLTALVERA